MKAVNDPLNKLEKALRDAKVKFSDIGTTAAKAPWNKRGKRLYDVTVKGRKFESDSIPGLVKLVS